MLSMNQRSQCCHCHADSWHFKHSLEKCHLSAENMPGQERQMQRQICFKRKLLSTDIVDYFYVVIEITSLLAVTYSNLRPISPIKAKRLCICAKTLLDNLGIKIFVPVCQLMVQFWLTIFKKASKVTLIQAKSFK